MPISGYRIIASTSNGNEIRLYNRNTRKKKVIASPEKSSFMYPIFVDSTHILWEISEPVNGSYGGGSGLVLYDIAKQRSETIRHPVYAYKKYSIIEGIYRWRNSIAYIITLPVDSFYSYHSKFESNGTVIVDLQKEEYKDLFSKVAVDSNGNILYLDDDHELRSEKNYLIRYNSSGKQIGKKELPFKYDHAYMSPSAAYLLYVGLDEHFYLVNLKTFRKVRMPLPARELHSITWSQDCGKFAVVQDSEEFGDTDVLWLFRISY